jgi:hypothetical protein
MNGLSERLLVSHYENNCGGALRRLNAIKARLAALDWARTPVFEISGLKREELIAASSVILHEIYFDSLGGRWRAVARPTLLTKVRYSARMSVGTSAMTRLSRFSRPPPAECTSCEMRGTEMPNSVASAP